MGRDFDAGGVEQGGRGRDEDDGDQIARELRQNVPGIMREVLDVPRQHEGHARRRLKGPARGLGVRRRDAGQPEHDMRRDHAADQDGRQSERRAGAVPGQIEDERHGAGGASSDSVRMSSNWPSVANCKALTGDDADRAEKDEAAGRRQKAADHRIGHIADRAAHPRHSETAQHDAGQDGRERERDQDRRKHRRGRIGRQHALDHRRRQDARHGRGGTIRPRNRKRQRASDPDHAGEDGRCNKGRGDAIGQIGRQRAAEDQQRIGQSEGDGQNAGGAAAENVLENHAERS